MSARHPATVQLSLEEFARHGGGSGPHKDGWGIAWFDDGDVQVVRDLRPAASSPCVRHLQTDPPRSRLVMSHIRKATLGAVALRNCQPFARELGGSWHVFAHNGHLPGIVHQRRPRAARFQAVGDTDSEQAFCELMERMAGLWTTRRAPALQRRLELVAAFAAELRALGPANFLYCDGDALFVHGDRRHQADGAIRPPGLWRLSRHCAEPAAFSAPGLHIGSEHAEQQVTLVASVPLSAEAWVPLWHGELLALRDGAVMARHRPD